MKTIILSIMLFSCFTPLNSGIEEFFGEIAGAAADSLCSQKPDCANAFKSIKKSSLGFDMVVSDQLLSFIDYGFLSKEKHTYISVPEKDSPLCLEFVPSTGELRNQRIKVIVINDTTDETDKQSIHIYRKVFGERSVVWEFVHEMHIPKDMKGSLVEFKPDGSVVLFDIHLLLAKRFL